MSYSTNKSQFVDSNHFAIIKPRTVVKNWTNISGNIWEASVIQDEIIAFAFSEFVFTEVFTSTLPTGNNYYFDRANKKIRIYWDIAAFYPDPNSATGVAVATFSIFLGTISEYLKKDPTDPNSAVQFYDGSLTRVPTNKYSMSDAFFSSLPSQSSTISIINADGKYSQILSSCSFKSARVEIFHCLGNTSDSTNFRRTFVGYGYSLTVDDQVIDLRVSDSLAVFDNGFDGVYAKSGTDVAFPVPTIFGVVEGVRCKLETMTPNPSYWVAQARFGSYKTETYQFSFPNLGGGGTNTTTRTYIDNTANRLRIGDRICLFNSILSIGGHYFIDGASTRFEFVEVTNTGRDSGGSKPYWIEHAAIGSPMPATTYAGYAMVARRVTGFIDGKAYKFFPYRDYQESFDTNGASKIGFLSGYAGYAGLPRALADSDTVFTRCYGIDNDDLGVSGNINQNMISIIYMILYQYLKIPASDLETANFAALANDSDYLSVRRVSLSIPQKASDEFPTYRDLLSSLLGPGFLKLFINKNGKWDIKKTPALSAGQDVSISDDDLLEGSVSFEFNYQDVVSDVIVEYGARDVSEDPTEYEGRAKRVYSTSLKARYLHKTVKQRTFQAPFDQSSDASAYADRLRYLFGDRRGLIKLKTSFAEADTEIGNIVGISRQRIPGQIFDGETEYLKKGSVIELDVGVDSISMTLDDQTGIDNQEP